MITVYKEVTEWDTPTHNGVYHINSEGKLAAYQVDENAEVKVFNTALMFSKTRRKFQKLRTYDEKLDSASIIVEGSNGNKYTVRDGKCSCPGFTFRGTCKHIK